MIGREGVCVFESHDYAGDTGEKGYRKCTQSTGVFGKYLVEACGSSLVIESCWKVGLEAGDCVCDCVCVRRISGYPLPRPQQHTKLNNLLDKSHWD